MILDGFGYFAALTRFAFETCFSYAWLRAFASGQSVRRGPRVAHSRCQPPSHCGCAARSCGRSRAGGCRVFLAAQQFASQAARAAIESHRTTRARALSSVPSPCQFLGQPGPCNDCTPTSAASPRRIRPGIRSDDRLVGHGAVSRPNSARRPAHPGTRVAAVA